MSAVRESRPPPAAGPRRAKANFVANIKIGPKIYVGFGIVLLLLVGMAGLTVLAIEHLRTNFDDYANMASDALLVTDLDANMATGGFLPTSTSLPAAATTCSKFMPSLLRRVAHGAAARKACVNVT